MAFLNNNASFAVTGVGVFGDGNHDRVYSCRSPGKIGNAAIIRTAINVAGWIPGASIIAGIASIVLGILASGSGKNTASSALVVRGFIQLSQLGCILAPFDIGFSLARLVREHMKSNRIVHSSPRQAPRPPRHGTSLASRETIEPVAGGMLKHTVMQTTYVPYRGSVVELPVGGVYYTRGDRTVLISPIGSRGRTVFSLPFSE